MFFVSCRKYTRVSSRENLTRDITSLPSACVVDTSSGGSGGGGERPLAWGLVREDGSVGIVHTQEECRGRGLASRVVRRLASELRAGGAFPLPAYVAVCVLNRGATLSRRALPCRQRFLCCVFDGTQQ